MTDPQIVEPVLLSRRFGAKATFLLSDSRLEDYI